MKIFIVYFNELEHTSHNSKSVWFQKFDVIYVQ